MGNTVYKGSSAIRIDPEDGGKQKSYAPGDTITGSVTRTEPTVSAQAAVKITLYGRAKTKIFNHHGSNNQVFYRGRFTVIDDEALSRKIFEGPVHVASTTGPAIWPFSIRIPKNCSPRNLKNSAPRSESFLPLDAESIATQPLPDSFALSHNGYDAQSEGFIEYFLEATISYAGSRQSHDAILPIIIRSPNTDPPLETFILSNRRIINKLSSWRLLPDLESTELTFAQKRQKLFRSSKVPKLTGTMEMDVPSILQLGNPSLVPIHLRFVPDVKEISSELQDIPLKIELTSLAIMIRSRTDIRCHGPIFGPRGSIAEKDWTLQIWPPRAGTDGEPLYIPYSGELTPVDVGTRAGFKLPSYLSNPGTAPRDRLLEGFTTYNIKHSHTATFRLVAVVSGQEMKIKVEGDLTLLAPSQQVSGGEQPGEKSGPSAAKEKEEEAPPPPPFQEAEGSWIQPPAEADAPPTFEQAEKEEIVRKASLVGEREDSKEKEAK